MIMKEKEGVKVSIDKECFSKKPTSDEARLINSRIGKNITVLNCLASMDAFVHAVGEQGRTFSPATFSNGSKTSENFEQMQMFVLDFDGGISFKEVCDRAKQYDLPIFFSYKTFSSTDKDERFRVCFLNDIPIYDRRAAKIAKNMLMIVFHESDRHDNDVTKMYYGGNQLIYYDPNLPTVNLESLNRNMTIFLKDEKKGNYKREIGKFAKNNKVALNKKKLLDITMHESNTEDHGATHFDENSPSTIIMLDKANGEISSNIYYQINLENEGTKNCSVLPETSDKKTLRNHRELRSEDLETLGDYCVLYKEFISGSRILHHHELFGLITNLIHAETGDKKFQEILRRYSYFDDRPEKYDKWKKDVDFFNKNDYNSTSCKEFCPHAGTCKHGKDIVHTVSPKSSHVKLEGYHEEFVSIDEAVHDLREFLRTAIEADDIGIHVIKAQTAIGKTYTFIKLLKELELRFLIAASTNILKKEIFERAKKEGVGIVKTPSLHEIKAKIPSDVWKHIEKLYQTGRYSKVHPYIKRIVDKKDIPCLSKYLERLKRSRESNKHMVTTHKKLLYLDAESLSDFDVVIIDEDIVLKSFVPNHISVPISKLKELAKISNDPSIVYKIKTLLKCIKTETLFTLESFQCPKKSADTSIGIDVPAFCLAEHFYYRNSSKEKNLKEDEVVFMNPVSLNENVKYIIVSATADEEIYRYVFGDRVRFYECRKARYEGVLNQYVGRTFSRASIDSDPGILDHIVSETGIKNFITFKKYERGPLYIGNVEGSNMFEGEDINVAATPYEAEFLYKLFPYALGLPCDYDDEMDVQTITRNGYMFNMNTYEDEILRNFQLWMIESQLEQAVGRARLLRYDCVVNLFSNYPLSQAVIRDDFNFNHD